MLRGSGAVSRTPSAGFSVEGVQQVPRFCTPGVQEPLSFSHGGSPGVQKTFKFLAHHKGAVAGLQSLSHNRSSPN